MNILYFTRTMGLGGTEKVILQLCSSMKGKFNKIVVCSCGGVNVIHLDNLGIKHYKIGDIESKDFKTVFSTFTTLLKIIKKEKIDIIHTHHRMAAFYVKILSIFTKKFNFIHTSHNTFNNKKLLTYFTLRKCKTIAVGDIVKRNLTEEYGINSNNIQVIHNSIEINDIEINEIEEINEYKKNGYFIVGNIGRLSEQKGMEYYIKAMSKVVKINPKIVGVIVGDGEKKEELRDLIKSLKLENNIKLLGYRDDILNTIRQLDLVVLSSLWEGYPLLPIETFAMGKTIVATNVDGTPEIVKDNENGILVKPRDSEAIANAIINLYNDKEKIHRLERQAQYTYNNNLKFEVFVNKYKNLYMNFK